MKLEGIRNKIDKIDRELLVGSLFINVLSGLRRAMISANMTGVSA